MTSSLSDIGQFLLSGKGGTVGATTVTNFILRLGPWSTESFMLPFPSGRLKVTRYSSDGKEVGAMNLDRNGIRR